MQQRSNGGIWLFAIIAFLLAPHLAAAGPLGSPAATRPSSPHGDGRVARTPGSLTFTNGAGCRPKSDWRRVDPRVRTVLTKAAKRYSIRVSCLRSGHSRFVKGTRRTSNHYAWRAVDIDRVNGQRVSAANPAARWLALAIGRGSLGVQPSEVGSPWTFGRRPWFTDASHRNHLHIGFRR